MTARRLLPAVTAAALLAVSPATAQEPSSPPDYQEAPAPAAVPRARAARSRAERNDGEARADRSPRRSERAASDSQEARPRVRTPATDAPPVAASAEEQGGRRRPGGGGAVGGGRGGSGSGEARPRSGGVRRPDAGGGRDSGGGPRPQAVPRSSAPRPPRTVYVAPNYGRRFYYGPTGLGYWAYDPWSWYGYGGWGGWGYYGNWSGYYGNWNGGYGYGAYVGPSGWSIGSVRLKVRPRDAEVYVDGYYAGIVDDFDGAWQRLRLDDGGHRIEIRAPGLNPLVFDVMVQPGRTITYRGDLGVIP
jgi:hypothetical protein